MAKQRIMFTTGSEVNPVCVAPGCRLQPSHAMSEDGHSLCSKHEAEARDGGLDLGHGMRVVLAPDLPKCEHRYGRNRTDVNGITKYRVCELCDDIQITKSEFGP